MNDKLSEITSKLTSLAGELEHVKTNQSQVKEQDNKLGELRLYHGFILSFKLLYIYVYFTKNSNGSK